MLGFDLPGPFDYVMYIVENCYDGCSWAAYAGVNHWMSLYRSHYYKYTGVLMHEFGHNLGFAHSGGLDGSTYTDHTCLMGNPLFSDDIGKMCFNPAKSWQLGWYGDAYATLDPTVDYCWSGTLIGIGEWDNGDYGYPVVLKLETGTEDDIFIGFNRAAGPNAENDEADDEVTIIEAGANGNDYSPSKLKAHLVAGESYTFSDWSGTGNNLVVTAEEIDISNTPGTAKIKVRYGESCTDAPTTTEPPSLSPSIQILFEVSVTVKTDVYAQETSWDITTINDPSNVLMSGENYYNGLQVFSTADMLTCGPTYRFTMKDAYGDGICCSSGDGYYILTVQGEVIKEGGEFNKNEMTEFSGCYPTVAPVVSPTAPDPTVAPVVSPTSSSPTAAPVIQLAPTFTPTVQIETSTPTEVSPTSAPTAEQSTCIECSNVAKPSMVMKGKTCEELSETKLVTKCRESKYIQNNYCELSCYLAGVGYEGVVCCT